VLKVKANQKGLLTHMQHICSQACGQQHASLTKQKGRWELRQAEVFAASGTEGWCGLNTFIKVTRQGKRQGQDYEQVSYYISDLRLRAAEFLQGIREYWTIENGLHWIKDTIFQEDRCRTRTGNGAANLSLLRGFAITMLTRKGNGVLRTMRQITNKPEKIAELLE